MKNNISYYPHKTNSNNHWKFKTLRKKFSWAGEGRFWALHNIICDSEDCFLLLEDEEKFLSVAADIDLTSEELSAFIDFLITKCKLLVKGENGITTETAQETLNGVMSNRKYQRDWKKEKLSIETGNSSIESKLSNIDSLVSMFENEQTKLKETKLNQSESNYGEPPPQIDGYRSLEQQKNKVLADENFVAQISQLGVAVEKIPLWLDAFNRRLTFTGETLKQNRDYRLHFSRWLPKITNYRTMNPLDYQPISQETKNNNYGNTKAPTGTIIPTDKKFGKF